MTYTVSLPWPNSKLSPNARTHWRPKAEQTRIHRNTASCLTRKALGRDRIEADTLPIAWTFYPPSNRRRDMDNLVASCKAYADGLSDALFIDDSKFQSTYAMGDVTPGGAVVVVIGGAE